MKWNSVWNALVWNALVWSDFGMKWPFFPLVGSDSKNCDLKKLGMVKNIDFENLAIEANNISMNLNDLNKVRNTLEVMHVRGRSPFWGTEYKNRSNSKSSERSSSERRCFRCGRKGHIRSQCNASRKTVNRYKKFLEDQGSRSRSQSRVTFNS